MAWKLAYTYNDPTGLWNNEPKAYDNLTSNPNYAGHVTHPQNTWTSFLTIYYTAHWSNKMRAWRGSWLVGYQMGIDIDVYHSGQWWNVKHGNFSVDSGGYYTEWGLGGTYQVTAHRIRCKNQGPGSYPTFVWEVQSWETTQPFKPCWWLLPKSKR